MDHGFELVNVEDDQGQIVERLEMEADRAVEEESRPESDEQVEQEKTLEEVIQGHFGSNTCDALNLVLAVIKMIKFVIADFRKEPAQSFALYVHAFLLLLHMFGMLGVVKHVFSAFMYLVGFIFFFWVTIGVVKKARRRQE